MPTEETSGWCDYCKRFILARRQAPNHVVHLIVTIFTCGLWVIPWALLALFGTGDRWKCPVCGGLATERPQSSGT